MFISIRKYRMKGSVEELARKVENEFVPMLKSIPGLKGYHVLDAGDGRVASISLFDSRDSALASNEKAGAWVRDNLAEFQMEPLETFVGESRVDVTMSTTS